jgi:oligopeptidase A
MFKEFNNDIKTIKEDLLQKMKDNLQKIDNLVNIKNKTYDNFIYPLSDLEEEADMLYGMISHQNSVNNSDLTQEIINEVLPEVSKYETNISTDTRIYNGYKDIKANCYDELDNEQKKVINDGILHFHLGGADLNNEDKKILEGINEELSKLSKEFSQNIIDSNKKYEMIIDDYEDVKEIPKNDLDSAKFEKDNKTYYKFTLFMPSYIAYMTYGSSQKRREELYKAYSTRANGNSEVIDKILVLKEKKAKLFDFDNYAAYSNAFKDAKSVDMVESFLKNLSIKSKEMAIKEFKELEEFANTSINSYDSAYYSEKLRARNFDINEEYYQDYFEKTSTLRGVLDFLEKSFSIKIKKTIAKTWDDKVEVFDFYRDGEVFGRMYFDLEAREGKRDGAWMDNFETYGINANKDSQLASAFILCNFPPSSKGKPSLLRHRDVETLFHEMGHGIHHIFSKVKQKDISGVNGVKWDVIEFPSQFLEQFAYDKETIKLFAKHHKTNEELKDEDIDKLIKARNFQSSMQLARQCEFSIFDIKLHKKLYQKEEVQNLLDDIREQYSILIPPKYNKFQNSFSHIFAGGYSAGYYSYKWAEVLSADLFLESKKHNIWNKYLENVLYLGGSKNMGELFFNILGREPRNEALLELSGVK